MHGILWFMAGAAVGIIATLLVIAVLPEADRA